MRKATSSQNGLKHGLYCARLNDNRKAFLAHLRKLRGVAKR